MTKHQILNERKQPLIGVQVEAVSLTTGAIIGRATTDMNGIADFPSLPTTGWYPRAQVTRNSGKSGGMSLNGKVEVNPVPTEPEVAKKPVEPLATPEPILPPTPTATTVCVCATGTGSGVGGWGAE